MENYLEIPSKIESIKVVENFIDEITNEMDLEKSIYGNVLISVVEAVNNCILHGNGNNPEKYVKIHCTTDEDMLTFLIEDQGEGFDFTKIPDPTAPENLESLNGRGIFLMNSLSDEINYYNNGAKIEMKFKIN